MIPATDDIRLCVMEPVTAVALFIGIPVGLAVLVSIAVGVPKKAEASSLAVTHASGGLITSAPSVPNPLPRSAASGSSLTGGARAEW